DHANARLLADGLAQIGGIRIDPARVVTNIVSFEVDPARMDAGMFQRSCAERGLRMSRYLGNSPRLRMVTQNDVSRANVEAALVFAIQRAAQNGARAAAGATALDATPMSTAASAHAQQEMDRTPGMTSTNATITVTFTQSNGTSACTGAASTAVAGSSSIAT